MRKRTLSYIEEVVVDGVHTHGATKVIKVLLPHVKEMAECKEKYVEVSHHWRKLYNYLKRWSRKGKEIFKCVNL